MYARVQLDAAVRETCVAPVTSAAAAAEKSGSGEKSSSTADRQLAARIRCASFDAAAAVPQQTQFALPVFDLQARVRVSLYSRPTVTSSSAAASGKKSSASTSSASSSDVLLGEVFCALGDLVDQRARDGWHALIGGTADPTDDEATTTIKATDAAAAGGEVGDLRPILRLQTRLVFSESIETLVTCAEVLTSEEVSAKQ